VARNRLTFRRLSGLDRSGPPHPATLPGAPLRIWTIPNAIGFVRLALIPVFVVLGLSSDDGTDALPVILFAIVAWSDYADGIAARVTGQYSRFGTLLDPVVDRLLVVGGLAICWHFELLPRWAIAALVARELFLLIAGRIALSRSIVLQINWWGRAGVWPTMSAIFFAMCGLTTTGRVLLYIGLVVSYIAAAMYTRDALRFAGNRPGPSSSA
jgi:CDP-diacylglycerol--glycerol-3-phosphate 3-phosphatidyltransferase